MTQIKTILIDDEPKALAILKNKIERLCPALTIVGESQDPHQAIELIEKQAPSLVFLDIAMPKMSGFDLLKKLPKPNFEIIFATAFDTYAIDAINHCAIGYLVKPIDNEDLIKAVSKAIENIDEKNALEKNKVLIENLGIKKFQDKKIIIPTQEGLEFVEISSIIHCEGSDGYTKVHRNHKKSLLSSNSIGHFIKMLEHLDFYQVHKSHLINLNFIEKYLNEGYVVVQGNNIPISRNRRSQFLAMLKEK
jgi:two-component system, LytTR family, response regulator